MPVLVTRCCLVDLIDLTLGDEDANSKVDVVTNVEVNVGENVCLSFSFVSYFCDCTQLSVQVLCVCEGGDDWQVRQYWPHKPGMGPPETRNIRESCLLAINAPKKRHYLATLLLKNFANNI